jgi:hypothetical protein
MALLHDLDQPGDLAYWKELLDRVEEKLNDEHAYYSSPLIAPGRIKKWGRNEYDYHMKICSPGMTHRESHIIGYALEAFHELFPDMVRLYSAVAPQLHTRRTPRAELESKKRFALPQEPPPSS